MTEPLTPRQQEVLDFLIEHVNSKGYPPTVREIGAHLGISGPKRAKKFLDILERKGHLTKEKRGRAFVYRPSESQNQVISSMVNDFLQRVFDGAAQPLLLNMVKEKKISREDLREIERLIEDVE